MPDEPGRAASPAPSVGRAAKVPRGSLLGSGRPASPSAAAPKRCGASLPRRRGEPVRPSPVAASPSEPGLAAWRLSTAGGPEPAGASSGAGGLSRPDCLLPPEALGRPIQPLGRHRAWRRGGHRVRGQRRRLKEAFGNSQEQTQEQTEEGIKQCFLRFTFISVVMAF
uniref:Uncharacterized protein n=1 Tax=Sphaerodactylus townsendi TaxID=933632 RepID=A0ACB8FNM4_9SAUR